jgi:pimeloyl-ACP methyl ester carboxylesterase
MQRRRRFTLALALAGAFALATAGAASAREQRVVVDTPAGPGPAEFNKVWVDKYGPKDARRILVLMPGTIGGSGDFTLSARYLVKRIKGLQVWAIDRRSQALEDTEMFARALRGEVSLQQMFDYYLGHLDGATPPESYSFVDGSLHPYARDWGMEVALEDARAVVKQARGKGKSRRKVVLGGHSLGASLAVAYAAWDFKGRPGYKDIAGIVAIDGGLLRSFGELDDLAQTQDAITELEGSDPFTDLLEIGIPEAAGIFAEVGGIYARLAPNAPATHLQDFPLLPPEFNPPFPVTSRGLLGHAFDRETSPDDLALIHINGGGLAPTGDPRDWVDGGVTPVSRLAATFGQEPANGVEWFFPRRLTIDTDAASPMARTASADFLGLRLFHTKKIDDPLYVIQTALTDGRVLQGGRNLIKRAKITKQESVLVNADPKQAHLDPLIAAPKRNAFFTTVDDFLRKAFGGMGKKGKKGKGHG